VERSVGEAQGILPPDIDIKRAREGLKEEEERKKRRIGKG
jgi:hypothetical protein